MKTFIMKILILFCSFLFFSCVSNSGNSSSEEREKSMKVLKAPERIKIIPDDYHTELVGKTADGSQFFVTTPFVAKTEKEEGREFVAVFLWNADGSFRDIIVDDLGPRSQLDETVAESILEKRFSELGEIKIQPIEVSPFKVKRFGVVFGLIYNQSDEDEWIELHPGNYIAFTPPWNGDYDT